LAGGGPAEEIFANLFAGSMPERRLPLNGPGCSPCSRGRSDRRRTSRFAEAKSTSAWSGTPDRRTLGRDGGAGTAEANRRDQI